jgi:hypothetical protein
VTGHVARAVLRPRAVDWPPYNASAAARVAPGAGRAVDAQLHCGAYSPALGGQQWRHLVPTATSGVPGFDRVLRWLDSTATLAQIKWGAGSRTAAEFAIRKGGNLLGESHDIVSGFVTEAKQLGVPGEDLRRIAFAIERAAADGSRIVGCNLYDSSRKAELERDELRVLIFECGTIGLAIRKLVHFYGPPSDPATRPLLPPAPTVAEQVCPAIRAIGLMLKAQRDGRPIQTVTALAQMAGCDRTTLSRDPQFKAFRRGLIEGASVRRGRRTDDGDIEADVD